ncbi:condensation domain-containing protein [Serratia marcescens]|uniref:condensation domain-containing protein n=2 Tax=Serratia marcescens TaxID=615 RepID=UPI00074500C6|nr:condensation domain-containing protein [Serratia marcescens]MBH3147845.1 non-ribosomal peptide synthetase [Serratia marcescens]CUY07100.1 Dimodular nonribosomal peptide synthase [Serratia marcescens]CUZ25948.1 Dimodular nonribosomal peptide synthase [Serratia marcescens]CVA19591.1 Dimodular nonribosomal peptide synthase [Serratia marcescens]CVB60744.1 Dimodular nonribosomal peptide synthase [Serratia marcescens]
MIGDFDSILSDEEAQRLESAFQALGAASASGERPVSEAEERAWFAHLQQGDARGQRALAWRLTGDVDIAQLTAALQALVRETPGVDVRYVFDDENGLVKRPAGSEPLPLSLRQVADEQQAICRLLQAQATPFVLESEAPLRCLLLLTPGDNVILGVVLHDILAETLPWRHLPAMLSARYNGDAMPLPFAAEPVELAETPEPQLPWVRQAVSLQDYRSPAQRAEALPTVGARVVTRIARSLLPANDTPRALLAAVAARFAEFVAAQAGGQAVQLCVPAADTAECVGLELGLTAPPLMRLTVQHGEGDAGQRLLAQTVAEQPDPQRAQLLVAWRDDLAAEWRLEGVHAERLLLPPLHTPFELALLLELPEAEALTLELVTDPRLSPHVAPFLLEQFSAFLAGQRIAVALPAAESVSPAMAAPAANGDADESVAPLILQEFREALVAPEMTLDEDFFDRGGHSLVATRVIGRLLSLHQIEININDLFSHPTARGLAGYAKRLNVAQPNAAVATADDHDRAQAPLSLAQESLWKVYEAFGHDEIFNLPFSLRFFDAVDETALRQAFIDVMTRHTVLRSRFVEQQGAVVQVVVPAAELPEYQWFRFSHETPAGNAAALLADAGQHRFDLAAELPLRVTLLRDADNGQQLLSLLFHHVVLDEWSLNLMMDELGVAYRHRVVGQAPQWSGQPPQFHAFARQQRASGVQQQHLDYWLDALRGAPVGQPIFRQEPSTHPAVPAPADVNGGWLEFEVDPAVAEGLYQLARRNNASLFNVVYAGITSALRLLGGPADLLVGTSTSGRNDAEFFDTVGYFTTVVVHRVRFDEGLTVAGLVSQVKNTINGSLPYTDIPIDLVEEGLFGVDADRKNHMFEVFIQIHSRIKLNGEFRLQDGSAIAYRQVEPEKAESLLGLQFEVMEDDLAGKKSLRVMMTYRQDHYSREQANLIADGVQHVFTQFAQHIAGDIALAALPPGPQA